ncbi:glycoside hydrolase family 78 protein [Saccharococcus caldoxylosilyticus]|uniref:glycoside hydrolase family 78 protein n=1 Tax=Saccharococcus caldoxylosilyticus TaxID=81408 RepID=UPI0002E79680|nr:glycoside hydrolase family 78 protein [Parageobacillus caldoxylosilyticus]
MNALKVKDLRCEYKTNPLGLDVRKPRISWRIESDRRGTMQRAYRLQVSIVENDFENLVWDTGYIESDQSIHIEYDGPELTSRTRYYYRVKIWDNFGRESDWSETAWWETAFFDTSEWKAQWITPDPNEIDPLSEPVFLLRKSFELKKGIDAARVYVTGVGLYELYLNGERVGEDLLTPGWTSYKKRLQYQTYDVTHQLQEGSNAIGIMLADGWYKGTLGWEGKRHIYGDRRAALVQLHVRYEDGTEEKIVTDQTWKASTGPILSSEIYHGEVYDARLEKQGWSHADFDDTDWKDVSIYDLPLTHLVAQENWPTRVTETVRPISTFVTPAGETVLDMGQNMVGRIRMTVHAPAGTRITLQHAEVLDKEGNFYTGNLRKAKQTVIYIAKGEGTEVYAPHFTFQGFRYVKVEGYPGQENGLSLDCFIGEVIHSDMEPTGYFECSNPLVNQLQQNIRWGQRGNFVDVPTDCPQRDERLGWTGDAQVFIRTALFNYQGAPFFTKWLRDLRADQLSDGGVPFVIPDVLTNSIGEASSAAWGDAAVICPWTVYLVYGDKRLLSEQYDSMKAWVEYIRNQGNNEYLWNTGFHFGDWLALDAKENSYIGATPKDLIATAFYAYSTRLVRDAAVVLEKAEDVRIYSELLHRIIAQFREEFVTPSGRLVSPTQTAHVLALMFDLVEGETKKRIAHELNEMIIENDYHLTTGFVGTPYLCFVLSNNGYHETAMKLLLQDTYPSWLYSVKKGATTIWEHWDSIKPDGSFWSDDMNSFNHYAYGSIGDWMYRVVAGLDMDETEPAFKRIRIQPRISGPELTYAKASYHSMYGLIESSWHLSDDEVEVKVQIPANTTAEVLLPDAKLKEVKESGSSIESVTGIYSAIETTKGVQLTVGSGVYHFVYPNKHGLRVTFSADTRLIDLLAYEEAVQLLETYAPGITAQPTFGQTKTYTLRQLASMPKVPLSIHQLDEIVEKLNALDLRQAAIKN